MVETVFIILCVLFLRPNIKFIDLTCIVLVCIRTDLMIKLILAQMMLAFAPRTHTPALH